MKEIILRILDVIGVSFFLLLVLTFLAALVWGTYEIAIYPGQKGFAIVSLAGAWTATIWLMFWWVFYYMRYKRRNL